MKRNPGPATVFLIDDDASVLKALTRLLRSAGLRVAAYQSADAFLEQRDHPLAGCLVLDVTMPGISGPQLQEHLNRSGNSLPIIFLTGDGDVRMSVRAMKAGAVDFLSKPCGDAELLEAIRSALARDARDRARREAQQAIIERFATLTPREHEVMLGVVAGKMNKTIAAELGTVEKTIKVHRGRVMEKLQVDSVADLVRLSERLDRKI